MKTLTILRHENGWSISVARDDEAPLFLVFNDGQEMIDRIVDELQIEHMRADKESLKALGEALTTEQPDPTAETLQEADAIEAKMDANQKLEIATAKYLASNGASPSAERAGPADGLEAADDDIEWAEKEARAIAAEMDAEEIAENGVAYADAPATIGFHSDVSDDDGLIDDTAEQLENDEAISAPRDELETAVQEIIDATDDTDTAEAETPEAVTDAVAALADADDYAPTDSEARQQAETQAAANGYARFSPFGQQG